MLEIIEIKENDLEDLSLLLEELTDMKTDTVKMKENFRIISSDVNYILLGAKYNNRLAGSLMGIICYDFVGDCRPFMVIENVIVTGELRGKGIGMALINEIEKTGRGRNCSYTMFVSDIKRAGAHRFYEAAGYGGDIVRGFRKFL